MLMGNQTCGKLHRCAFLGHFTLNWIILKITHLSKEPYFFASFLKSMFRTSSILYPAVLSYLPLLWDTREPQGRGSLVGSRLWDRTESDTPEGTSAQLSSVAQSCPTLCDPMNRSTPGLPVHHQLPEFTQTHVHRVSDAIQPSHPQSSPSPPAPNPSQHQSLFQWVSSSHEVAEVLEFQL